MLIKNKKQFNINQLLIFSHYSIYLIINFKIIIKIKKKLFLLFIKHFQRYFKY